MQVLEEIGMNFLLPEAREILRQAGAEVDGEGPRVRFDRALVEEAVARAPSLVRTRARNPENDLTFGANHINFAPVGGPPNFSDLDGGRRPGTLADLKNFMRLAQSLNICHFAASGSVEPLDCPPNVRHLDVALAAIRLSDKLRFGFALGGERARDHLEMGRISTGLTWDEFSEEPRLYTVINANSPLQYDIPMLEGMIEMARRKQLLVITPFTLAGAMAPITMPGAVVQQNAEALAGIAFGPVRHARHARGLWRLHLQRGHEVGRAGLRHAGVCPGDPDRRPARAPLPRALPGLQRERLQRARRPIGLRVRDVDLGLRPGAHPTWSCTASAGSRAGFAPPSRSSFSTPRCCR